MGLLVDLLVIHPMLAVLQAGASVLLPEEHPRARRLQRYTAALSLLGLAAMGVGLWWGMVAGSAAGCGAGVFGYGLMVMAGRMGERLECRVWASAAAGAEPIAVRLRTRPRWRMHA